MHIGYGYTWDTYPGLLFLIGYFAAPIQVSIRMAGFGYGPYGGGEAASHERARREGVEASARDCEVNRIRAEKWRAEADPRGHGRARLNPSTDPCETATSRRDHHVQQNPAVPPEAERRIRAIQAQREKGEEGVPDPSRAVLPARGRRGRTGHRI
jgi:hypothetical protein